MEIDCEITATVMCYLPFIQDRLLSVTSKSNVHEVLVNHFVKLDQEKKEEKVWLGELIVST